MIELSLRIGSYIVGITMRARKILEYSILRIKKVNVFLTYSK